MAAEINWHRYGSKLRHCVTLCISVASELQSLLLLLLLLLLLQQVAAVLVAKRRIVAAT